MTTSPAVVLNSYNTFWLVIYIGKLFALSEIFRVLGSSVVLTGNSMGLEPQTWVLSLPLTPTVFCFF